MKHKRINLLKHPVASELLKYKWNTYGLPVFILSFILNVLFITLLTVTVRLTPLPQRVECQGKLSISVAIQIANSYSRYVETVYDNI